MRDVSDLFVARGMIEKGLKKRIANVSKRSADAMERTVSMMLTKWVCLSLWN